MHGYGYGARGFRTYPNVVRGSALDRILGAGGLDYGFFDFTQTDRTFQESVGPTPADDIGEAVGLWLDRHGQGNKTLAQVMAGQVDLNAANAHFDSQGAWTNLASGVTISGGVMNVDGVSGELGRVSAIGVVSGRLYRVTWDIVSISTGGLGVKLGGTNAVTANAVGSYETFIVATSTDNVQATAISAAVGSIDNISVKLVPSHYALQATGNARGIRQADGIKYDGSDDNHLTDIYASSAAGCIIVKATMPATIAATQAFAGQDAGTSQPFCYLGQGATGSLRRGIGNLNADVGPDVRGQTIVAMLSWNGTIGRVFLDGTLIDTSGTYTGAVSEAHPFRIGARNTNGGGANYSAAFIEQIAFGDVYLSEADAAAITAEWAD